MITGYIYKHTSPSGKSYIGKSLAIKGKRWKEHVNAAYDEKYKEYNYPLQQAIRKYGEDTFEHEILEDDVPEELLSELEVLYIEKHNTFYDGYNQTKGGEGTSGERSVEARERIAKANKERIWTEEMIQKMQISKQNVCIKPWYIKHPDGNYEEVYTITKRQYAVSKGWHAGSFANLFSKEKIGKEVLNGQFKGYTVGNIGGCNE